MKKLTDFEESLKKLMNLTFIKYRGCLIEKKDAGYSVHGVVFTTITEAQQHIDELFLHVKNLVK